MTSQTAGTQIFALDSPAAVSDQEDTNINGITSTSWATGSPVCGVAFTAPTSGRVIVMWGAHVEGNNANNQCRVSIRVRTGSTIDSGTTVSGPHVRNSVHNAHDSSGGGAQRIGAGTFRVIEGLEPGDSYNAVTQHRVSGTSANGDVLARSITVISLP